MREYGLIGYPLSHSFSQKYFTEKFQREGISDAVFYAFSIPSINDLSRVLQEHPLLKGFSITIPYKRSVIEYLDTASTAVKKMNACNCVKIKDGKLYGYNTDIVGFKESFIKHLKPYHTKALILGTGGAASAIEFVLNNFHIDYRFVSRKKDDSKNIAGYAEVNATLLNEYKIIVNTTPLGTYPDINAAPDIPYQLLTPQHYLFDLVYNPAKTKFLALGEEQGATIQNGYEMLLLQSE
ncbi:MAG TPA: shikimate dehydrogenase, partial [Chitinophagaceae bacterium]